MHTGRHYSFAEVALWTRRETFLFILIASVPTCLYALAGWTWLPMPWLPIAMVGTAVAFITGFKNNASYSRLWEARQIWGGIVNISRSFAMSLGDFLGAGDHDIRSVELRAIHRRMVLRHIGWLTALRYQLRQTRSWENMQRRHNAEYRKNYQIPEWEGTIHDAIKGFMQEDELEHVCSKKNCATHILKLQGAELRGIAAGGLLTEYRHVALERMLEEMYALQGKCERIKNFPYPRQFATLNLFFVWLFIFLVPFGMLQEFQQMGEAMVWLTIPTSVIVAWVFHTMDKIGESSENPFEGGPNDVPITGLSRTIEIDLREMLDEDEEDVPAPLAPTNHILM